jgi:hypothetical protein
MLLKYFSELRAAQYSTLSLIILCFFYVWLVFSLLKIRNSRQALLIGLLWVILTVTFEFSFGRLTDKTWEMLFQDYNLIAGRLWVLFLLSLSTLPYFIYKLKSK